MDSFSWQAPEYYHERKTADWYWALGIIAISAATVSVVFNNVILAVLIGISAFTLMIFAARPPKIVEVKIDAAGVVVGKLRYPYANLQSFWIHEYENTNNAKLLFTSTKPLAPHIVIPLDLEEINAADIRELLTPHLPEVEDHEPLLQLVMEYLGL